MSDSPLQSKLSFLQSLTLTDRAVIEGLATRRVFARGVFIYHKGSPGQTLYAIESGVVRIFVVSEAGQEITLDVRGPGEVFGELGFLDGLPRSVGAVTLSQVTVLALRRDDVVGQLEAHPGLAVRLLDVLTARLRSVMGYAESLAFLDVNGRLAVRLLDLADRFGVESADGKGETVHLKLTQSELASWVVTTRETVNKVLTSYRDQQLIEVADQRITILDRRGLRRHAGM